MTEWIVSVRNYLYAKIAPVCAFSILLISCQPIESPQEPSPPNVILIMTDDQGYGDLGAHGNPWIKTPHMDSLYAQSTRFTNFHVGTTERTLITDTQREEYLQKGKDASVMTNRWRLVFDEELYDMENDPGQTQNVIGQYPGVVSKLRAGYASWWNEVSHDADEYARIIVGSDEVDTVTLNCHDFHPTQEGYPAWNQEMIRNAQNSQGFWTLDVAKAGKYRIELRRWPKAAAVPISGSVPHGEEVSGGKPYSRGKELPLTKAGIQIGEQEMSTTVAADDSMVSFEISLPEGNADLLTWYKDKTGNTYGGYYVYIAKL